MPLPVASLYSSTNYHTPNWSCTDKAIVGFPPSASSRSSSETKSGTSPDLVDSPLRCKTTWPRCTHLTRLTSQNSVPTTFSINRESRRATLHCYRPPTQDDFWDLVETGETAPRQTYTGGATFPDQTSRYPWYLFDPKVDTLVYIKRYMPNQPDPYQVVCLSWPPPPYPV